MKRFQRRNRRLMLNRWDFPNMRSIPIGRIEYIIIKEAETIASKTEYTTAG